ncbi:MAG: hypothetical protein IJ735_00555 [Clostridia bacterium]|nr:hypothetical protein [Clostridia bacterium]
MIDVLKKKAEGYEVVEVTKEYAADPEGNTVLVKEKQTTKHVPPDLSALKAYLDIKRDELDSMSDEELAKERLRLLNELQKATKKTPANRQSKCKKNN